MTLPVSIRVCPPARSHCWPLRWQAASARRRTAKTQRTHIRTALGRPKEALLRPDKPYLLPVDGFQPCDVGLVGNPSVDDEDFVVDDGAEGKPSVDGLDQLQKSVSVVLQFYSWRISCGFQWNPWWKWFSYWVKEVDVGSSWNKGKIFLHLASFATKPFQNSSNLSKLKSDI